MCPDATYEASAQRAYGPANNADDAAWDLCQVYADIAHALARGYTDLYYVNECTDEFIEFHTDDQLGVLAEARRGADFFEGCERDAKLFVHEEDQATFVKVMNPQFLDEALDGNKIYTFSYRRIKDGRVFYVNMTVSRMEEDERFLVIAVSDIDELVRQRQAQERIQEERIVYARLHALTGNFIAVYVVDPVTNSYREFSSTDDFVENFAQAKEGKDFFAKVREVAQDFNYPGDVDRFLSAFTKENVLASIEQSGIFTLDYRLMMESRPIYVQMKAAMVEEKDGPLLVVGINDVDTRYRQRQINQEIARQKEIYDQITASLTEQYDTLYYIDIATSTYIEISATDEYKKLNVPATGSDFFAESRRSIRKYVHPEDQEKVLRLHYKDVMLDNLKDRGSFSMAWRLVVGGQIKHIRHTEILARDEQHIVVCIKNIDKEVRAELALKADKEKTVTFTQIAERLADHYDLIYYINVESSQYAEYSTKKISGELRVSEEGDRFFEAAQHNAERLIHPEDRERVRLFLDRDRLITQLEDRRQLISDYRMVLGNGRTQFTRMSVTYSSDHSHFIICVENRDEDVRREQEHLAALTVANELARRDELTHTKNKTAYREMESSLQRQLEEGREPFAIVVCDINGLKHVNDTQGHKAGDEYIKVSCLLICRVFNHSPVFRIGGDEFVVVLRGQDYENRNSLVSQLRGQVSESIQLGEGPVVASGLAELQPGVDHTVEDVFNRADTLMYEEKTRLKEQQQIRDTYSLNNETNVLAITEERRTMLDSLYQAFSMVSDGSYVYLCDMKYDYSRWAKRLVDTYGLPSDYMYGAGDIWENCLHPEDRERYRRSINDLFRGDLFTHDMQYRVRRTTGEYDVCICRGLVIRDPFGELDYFVGTIQRIDGVAYSLSEDERRCIERMRVPLALCQFLNKGVENLAVSDGFCELFGYEDRTQAYADMNQNMFKDVHPDDTAAFTNAILRFGTENGRLDLLYRTKIRDRRGYQIIHLTGEHVPTDKGPKLAQLWFTDEGSYQEGQEPDVNQELNQALRTTSHESLTYYDYLTGLPNMSRFFERADLGRKRLLDKEGLPALMYIDLRGMKHYNHTYGFSEGDKLLRRFAQLLSRTFGAENCCHISADRFAALSDERILERQLNTLFKVWEEMGEDRHLPICVGVYLNSHEEIPVGLAYDRAKIACDALKPAYVSCFNYYSDELSEELERQQYILENLDAALSHGWIHVYYQPIIRAVNGKVCDEEALARWIDPEKGFLSPADFIPFLENAGLIYKLDLYVLERILKDIKTREAEGYHVVPHSINLSRSDFDACDMVEEVRRRVDAAGISHDRISIEITESVIGSDFEFMKEQVERFRALGFPVWMDDFGSGYSSLDVLQSIRFDLLKFDMGFMRKLDESEDGRTIMTELMKLALSLGIDTICEGVETEEQVHFLREIGCSKLQGFYYSKPLPFERGLAWHRTSEASGYEDPDETAYLQLLCGVNLYDVSVIAREETTSLKNTYNTLPMCIIEIKGDRTRFLRTNQSYRDFFQRFFGLDPSTLGPEFVESDAAFMHNVMKTCCDQGIRTFYDEKMPDGSIVHSFARRIAINPVTGAVAVAIAVLSIREPDEKLMVEQVLSVVEQFGKHIPGGFFIYRAGGSEELLYANNNVCDIFGCDSLEEFKELTGFTFRGMVHPDDYEKISASIEEQVQASQADLDFVEYRIIRKDGEVRRLEDYGHYTQYDDQAGLYYVFVSDITDKYERAQSDMALHTAVIEALTKAYDSVWLIDDIETERFQLFRIDKEMEHRIPANAALQIERLSQAAEFYSKHVLEEDRQRFLEDVAIRTIAEKTRNRTIYSVPFRRVFEDGIRHYRVEFTRLDLPDGKIGIVCGFKDVEKEGASKS